MLHKVTEVILTKLPEIIDDRLGMAENRGDVLTRGGLHVQEIGLRGLHQSLQLVSLCLVFVWWVQQVDVHDSVYVTNIFYRI